MSDSELDYLGDYFEAQGLINKGWEFHQFVKDYQLGYIRIEVKSNGCENSDC